MNKEDKFKVNDIIIFNPKYKEIKKIMGDKDYLEGVILAHTISKGLKVYANNSVFYLTRELLEKTNYDCIKLKYIEEENKMEYNSNENVKKLLAMWLKINKDNLFKKKKEEIEKIYDKDETVIDLNERIESINEIIENFKNDYPELNCNFSVITPKNEDVLTDYSKKEIENIIKKYSELIIELENIIYEVLAATLICETEDSLRSILKAYGIIDKNGKIKIK